MLNIDIFAVFQLFTDYPKLNSSLIQVKRPNDGDVKL
jgi:hypothetical protein